MWSKKYDKCIACGTTEKDYFCKGMCKDCYYKKYLENNFKRIYKNNKKYRENNLEKYKDFSNKYRKENRKKIRDYDKEYQRNKRFSNPRYKLKGNISGLINIRLHSRLSSKNGKATFSFLPYTIDDLIRHLESNFKKGMNWNNHNKFGWHIDHKIPDCKFDYKSVDDKEFQKCWALSNLQPLWAEENLKKSDKIIN